MKLKIPAGLTVGRCASERGGIGRYATDGVLCYAREGRTYLAATDGRVLAVLPVVAESPPERLTLLPPDAVSGKGGEATVTIDGEARRHCPREDADTVWPLPPQGGKFPDLAAVMPKAEALKGYTPVALDARLLMALASALSPERRLTLFVPPPDPEKRGHVSAPVVAVGHDHGRLGGVGLVMPMDGGDTPAAKLEYLARVLADLPGPVALTPNAASRGPQAQEVPE